MPLFVKRKDNGKIVKVRKYILDYEGKERIWSNDWYGKHTIGFDCEWNGMIQNYVSKQRKGTNVQEVPKPSGKSPEKGQ